MDGATSVGTGAAERVVMTSTAPLASELAFAAPDERCRIGIPAARGLFEPAHDVCWRVRRLPFEGTADEDALDGLGHVQPGATQRRVQGHDPVRDQPEDERGGLVAAQIVEHQEHPQGWQLVRQRERDGEAGLPPLPRGAALLLGLGWRLRQCRQDSRQLGLEPGVQDRVRRARDTFDAHLSGGRVKQGQQFGGAVADVLVRIAGRAGRRAPPCAGLRDRLIRPRFVLGPGRQFRLSICLLDQPLFTVASGS